jgi:glucose/arabinose dehydrogenase
MRNGGVTPVLLLTLVLGTTSAARAQVTPILEPGERCSEQRGASVATFEDANLEAAIRARLSIDAEQNLTCSLLAGLTDLTAENAGIESLVGIQNLTGLTALELNRNSITDIRPLSELTNLSTVGLVNNAIADIDPLRGLANLTDLRLQSNRTLTDIQPLLENAGLGAGDRVGLGNTSVRCADLTVLASNLVDVDVVRTPELGCEPLAELSDEPVVFRTFQQPEIRVSVVTQGLEFPWGMAFLPGGDILVTERVGRLRIIRNGSLDPEPITGVPYVGDGDVGVAGLLDVALHPRFADNNLVYLTYSKPVENGATIALARGRFDGTALRDLEDVFVAEPWGRRVDYAGSRVVFAPDGTLYMTIGGAFGTARLLAQDPSTHVGKVLRLRDDGSVPDDNPFVGRSGYAPEIFSLGHRNQQGAAIHPETGMLWTSEHAPQGGDEVNLILPGRNYGWPVVSHGREYGGRRVAERPWQDGMEQPMIVWLPSIAATGMTFYTGDRFPAWKGNLFVSGLMTGRIWGTGHVERIVLNRNGEELRREWLLAELGQRIRHVSESPDGLLYVLTDDENGALLRIEPVE